ncbi:MAG TPA: response regulator transcription factor [Candidatus Acidoferrales bacterium]|nr:response regulator transcription factor [Candidatus Acidoferrales bacterium]
MHILVVDDETKVASFIERALTAEHHQVDVAYDGEAALQQATATDYDLLILDVMLPKRDGFEVLRELRQRGSKLPVLLLTARAEVSDKVSGLDLGADDYLTKPFVVDELMARVRALLRRHSGGPAPQLKVADLILDPATRQVTRAQHTIELTAREYALLEFFLRNVGRVLSRAAIAQHVWGVNFDTFTNVIDVYVNYLRRKIDADFEPKLLHTVRGAGYVMKEPTP